MDLISGTIVACFGYPRLLWLVVYRRRSCDSDLLLKIIRNAQVVVFAQMTLLMWSLGIVGFVLHGVLGWLCSVAVLLPWFIGALRPHRQP